ncbi:MAG: DUF502 domain-containing protein [Bacteroidales bacterium]|nr:DUF502 domain-containing protein [Bacteroidales bacterium]
MAKKDNNIGARFLKYFGQGLLFVVPVFVTVAVLVYLFQTADALIGIDIPGLGIVILVVLVTLIGFIGTVLLTNPVVRWFSGLINRTPVVKIIYSSVKDLLSAFVGSKKKFTYPVLIRLSAENDMQQIGFLTQNDLRDLGVGPDMVSVYVPFAFSMMGNLYVVPKANVSPLEASPTETLKFVVSGGITNVQDQRKDKLENKKEA